MEANSNPPLPSKGDEPLRGLPPTAEQRKLGAAPRKPSQRRDRAVKDTPSFQEWVKSKTGSELATKSVVAKAVAVVAMPVTQENDSSQLCVQIEKTYKVRVRLGNACTHVYGDLHRIEWSKHKDVIHGLICAISELFEIPFAKIVNQADIAATPDGIARPSFQLKIPRGITDDEQRSLNVAISAFNQRLRGQDDSLNRDLFADADPKAVNAGRRAAEDVRRRAGGRSLPQSLTVASNLQGAKPVTLGGRIGNHPDPEEDGDPRPIVGRVISILTEEHKLIIRSPEPGVKREKRRRNSRGERLAINYSDNEHRAAVLKLPLGLDQMVQFIVTPRTGRNKDKLMLKSIGSAEPSAAPNDKSNTKP
jgi:hypothetical protein